MDCTLGTPSDGVQQNVTCHDEIAYSMQVTQHPVARLGPVESICWRPVVKFARQEGISST